MTVPNALPARERDGGAVASTPPERLDGDGAVATALLEAVQVT
ncbi:hypothetical protein ACXYTP_09310 [Tsukamurella ocularis]